MKQLFSRENPVIAASGQANLRWPHRFGWAYPLFTLIGSLIGSLIFITLITIAVLLSNRGVSGEQFPPSLRFVGELLLNFTPIILLVWGWLWVFERRGMHSAGFQRVGWWQQYLRGFGLGVAMLTAALGLQTALGGQIRVQALNLSPAIIGGVGFVLLGWLVQGAAEEILVRGLLLPAIGARWGVIVGIILSSLLFAAMHLLNPNVNLISTINIGLFGVFAALYTLREGSLWEICALHSAWNWAQANLYGLEVSGLQTETATILSLQLSGQSLISGGTFGLEGSLASTAILLIGCLLIMFWPQRV